MANALIAWDNAVVDACQIYNDGYGTYTATLENLKKASLAQRWVSPGVAAADTRFTCGFAVFGVNPTIALVALCTHNLTLSATVRVRASNVANFASTTYDSGTLNAYAAGMTEARRKGMRQNWIHRLSTPTAAPYWRFDISDSGNAAGFVSVGRLFAGTGLWQPTVNMIAGNTSLAWESNTEVQKALDGSEWFLDGEGHRVARFRLGDMPMAEMLDNAFDLCRAACSNKREVIFQYDPADTLQSVRRQMFGRLRTLGALEEANPLTARTLFEVKELL